MEGRLASGVEGGVWGGRLTSPSSRQPTAQLVVVDSTSAGGAIRGESRTETWWCMCMGARAWVHVHGHMHMHMHMPHAHATCTCTQTSYSSLQIIEKTLIRGSTHEHVLVPLHMYMYCMYMYVHM